ncbi:hypothetical protein D3C75_819110 [compost metagenome]
MLQSLCASFLQLGSCIRFLKEQIHRCTQLQTAAAFLDPLLKRRQRPCNGLAAGLHSRQQHFIHNPGALQRQARNPPP